MPSIRLTDAAVAKMKAPPGARRDVFDAAFPALGLRINGPTNRGREGRKSWRYWTRIGGKLKPITLGHYPAMTLAQARLAASGVQQQKQAGIDPAAAKAEARAEAERVEQQRYTIEVLVDEYVRRALIGKKRADRYVAETRLNLQNHVLSRWATRPISEITRKDVIHLLDDIKDRGSDVIRNRKQVHLEGGGFAANRTRSALRSMFGFAVDRDLLENNVALTVKRVAEEQPRDRVLNPDELAAIRAAARETPLYGVFFDTLLYTGCRRSEASRMQYDDIDFDGATWSLIADSVKSRRAEIKPLTPQVIAGICSLPRLSVLGPDGRLRPTPWVFSTNGLNPIRALSGCKQRIDKKIADMRGEPIAPWRLHDLRRSAASHMARLGVSQFIVGKVLGHADPSVTGRTYNQYAYAKEKRQALEMWAAYLDSLMQTPGNVVWLELA